MFFLFQNYYNKIINIYTQTHTNNRIHARINIFTIEIVQVFVSKTFLNSKQIFDI
jgi:hypothetical protein